MAKKKITAPSPPKTLCKHCERLKIDTQNLNWEYKPFTGHCSVDGKLKLMSNDGCESNYRRKYYEK